MTGVGAAARLDDQAEQERTLQLAALLKLARAALGPEHFALAYRIDELLHKPIRGAPILGSLPDRDEPVPHMLSEFSHRVLKERDEASTPCQDDDDCPICWPHGRGGR